MYIIFPSLYGITFRAKTAQFFSTQSPPLHHSMFTLSTGSIHHCTELSVLKVSCTSSVPPSTPSSTTSCLASTDNRSRQLSATVAKTARRANDCAAVNSAQRSPLSHLTSRPRSLRPGPTSVVSELTSPRPPPRAVSRLQAAETSGRELER